MYISKNYIEKPIHLVSINSFGKLVLHYEAISYLKTLKSPLSILSIAGPYRTGKSFLLNSIISNTQNLTHPNTTTPSFEVGHTTNQTTHGLWIWSKPLLAQDENNQITNVIVMDSEGYASSESTHDKRLITLAILLSTCFLFNSKGAIDKDSIFDIQFVIQVARMISQKEQIRTSQENMKGKCDFHWILRDFQLQLVNELGHKINPNEYMQNCLLQAESRVNQKTIQTLKQYFPQRTCHTLCHPTTQLQAEQRPQFISQILGLKQSILKKNMKSFNMSGDAFIELLQSYVDAMNEGEQINSVFQEGYDCRVRLDCLEKLNNKLKRLEQDHKNDELIDMKLLNIKSQIKQYYKQRMCSHKQITVLDNEVEERINEYQQDYNSSKGLLTSVKCMERQSVYKNVPIIVPKSTGNHQLNHQNSNNGLSTAGNRNIRLSIQCYENGDKSFLGDEELSEVANNHHHHHSASSHNNVRASRLVKQKASPQVKLLTNKIQQLQVSLHRTQLQLSTAECQLTDQKQQNQHLRKSFNQKEDQLMELIHKSVYQQKRHSQTLQKAQQEKKENQKQIKLLQSQIHKQSLLYEQKIQYLQMQLKFSDQQKMAEFIVEKNRYKKRVKELTEEIEEMGRKHKEETQQVRGIFSQQQDEREKGRMKTYWHMRAEQQEIDGKNIFTQLQEKVRQNQLLNQQVQQLKITNQKLQEQLQAIRFKSIQREQSLKQQLQQVTKRSQMNQEQLKTLYETKLMNKQSQISQLQTKIKSLNEIAIEENHKLIQSLKEMEFNFSQEKQDLFVMNNQLRNGCLQALQRVSGLKEEIQVKQKRCEQLDREKLLVVKKMLQLKDQHQKQLVKQKQHQKQLKHKLTQKIQEKQLIITQLQSKLQLQQHQLQQNKQHSNQVQLELQMQKDKCDNLEQQIQELNDKLKQLQYRYKHVSQDLIIKQHQLNQVKVYHSHQQDMHKKQVTQLTLLLQETKQQKTSLTQSISQINKQLQAKYQNLQLIYNDNHEYDRRKYQQTAKEMKQQQKSLIYMIEDHKSQSIKLGEKLIYTQKELQTISQQNSQYKQQLTKYKEQLQQKTYQLKHLLRQSSKHQALSTQKINFIQQKINLLTQQTIVKSTQSQSRQQQLHQTIISLKSQLQSQTKLYQQSHKNYQQTQNLYERKQSSFTELQKQAQQTQTVLMQQVQHLINRQSTIQKDNNIMAQNILSLQQLLRKHQIQSQNHIRLYNDKLSKVKQQKFIIQTQLNKSKQDHQLLQQQYHQLQTNYNNDFILWTKKFNKMEQSLKQNGWKHHQISKTNHNNNKISIQ